MSFFPLFRYFSLMLVLALSASPICAQTPRPEHPKPQFQREHWLNLNGPWDFAVDPGLSGVERGWHEDPAALDQTIIVPYPPESKLSGIENKDFMPAVWYHRTFTVPDDWDEERVFLHFGAVDYECEAWVNGQSVGRHYGGSVSFDFEITDALREGENSLVVQAIDDIRSGDQPAGKQSPTYANQGCCKYTRVTGIWQTVWLEARPVQYLQSVRVVPDLDQSRFVITPVIEHLRENSVFRVTLLSDEGQELATQEIRAASGIPLVMNVANPQAWGPDNPYLYGLRLELVEDGAVADRVDSYAGLRKVHIAGNKIYLNNEPIFLRLVLDQGFYPDGVWTAPSDAELKADIERSMAVGFNGARLHEKVFEERFLYWADRLGYLTWGEYPDWGVDRSYISPTAWLNLKREWREVMIRDINHPSIITWTPMNETHSAKKDYEAYRRAAVEIYDLTQDLDPTRPINETSGFLHIKTDIYTVHDYTQNPEKYRARYDSIAPDNPDAYQLSWGWYGNVPEYDVKYAGQPYVIDEYGGTFWIPEYADEAPRGNGRSEWGYGKSAQEVIDLIGALTQPMLDNPNIVGFTYTQLTDVEQEVNGIYTYDRQLKFDAEQLKQIFGAPAAVEQSTGPKATGE